MLSQQIPTGITPPATFTLLLLAGVLIIAVLKSYNVYVFKVSVKNICTVLLTVLFVNIYMTGRGHLLENGQIGDISWRSNRGTDGRIWVRGKTVYMQVMSNRRSNVRGVYDMARFHVADQLVMRQRLPIRQSTNSLIDRITTKSPEALEVYGWGKYLYEQESPQRLNPLWVIRTDSVLRHRVRPRHNKVPVILMWTTEQHQNYSVSMADGAQYMEDKFHCPVTNCIFTTEQSKYLQADAVVFFQMEHQPESPGAVPPRRLPHQRYVFLNRESPIHPYLRRVTNNSTFIQGFYNWTATYRMDADIHAPYIAFYKRVRPVQLKPISEVMLLKKKGVKMVAWFVSHCKTDSRREDYVKELSKYVTVDKWGTCGPYKCGRNHIAKECYKILNNYWFYLSFENALCMDYVTEKVLFPMTYADVVPIVFGAANYSKQLPPHSVINVMDFVSPRELAKFIIHLTENLNNYTEYFKWKKIYRPAYSPNPMCGLCEKLNEKHQQGQVYKDFVSWWNKDQCDSNWVARNKANW